MLTKLSSKNKITLPQTIVQQVNTDDFEVSAEKGRTISSPAKIGSADEVREKLEALGVSEDDVAEAILWARKGAQVENT